MVTLERSLSTATAKTTYPGLIYSSLPRTPHMSNLRESYRASDETKKISNGAITKITVKRKVGGIQLYESDEMGCVCVVQLQRGRIGWQGRLFATTPKYYSYFVGKSNLDGGSITVGHRHSADDRFQEKQGS